MLRTFLIWEGDTNTDYLISDFLHTHIHLFKSHFETIPP